MKNEEKEIRSFMKTLSVEDIADSVHLFGADFDQEEIDSLIERIISLYNEVVTLKNLVDRGFESENRDKVLIPQSRDTQTVVMQDYYRKESILEKLLSNKFIKDAVISKLVQMRLNESEQKNLN